jgi:hypothetical protein
MQRLRSKSIPAFEETLAAIDPLSDLVYRALERAAVKTRLFFASEKQPHDPFLAPCLMRFFTKHELRNSGIQAEEDGDATDFEGLPNNGLALFYRGHHARILKAATVKGAPWRLPGCGASSPKTDFYNQQLNIYTDGKGNMHTCFLNIIYLWDFNASFNLSGLYLGCPMAAAPYAKDVLTHWCEPVPHPAYSRTGEKSPAKTNEVEADEELESLLSEHDDEAIEKA